MEFGQKPYTKIEMEDYEGVITELEIIASEVEAKIEARETPLIKKEKLREAILRKQREKELGL